MMSAVLEFIAVNKRFGGTQAVDNVSLSLFKGEVLALLGENGAGKSTLIKLLAGIYPMDSGQILLDGRPQQQWLSRNSAQQPVAFIHQDLGLVEWMTVAENIALGMGYAKRMGLIDWRKTEENARRVMARVGCDLDPRRRIFSLTRAEKSLLAIGRALEVQARVLVLDEPSASLPMADVQKLFDVLRQLRERGMAIIYVSHRLDEVMTISDRAAVMRDGQLVAVQQTAQTSEAQLVDLIVGKTLQTPSKSVQTQRSAQPTVALKQVASANAGPVSFSVHGGEIVGLIGLRGAGHEAISRALFAREPLSSGEIELLGKPLLMHSPADAIAAGIAYVAGERLEESLAPAMNVLENLFPNPRVLGERGLAFNRRKAENRAASRLIQRFDVNPPVASAQVQQLSGGNQQKVVLARWLNLNKPLVILEEPTAGVDVGAKRQIYDILKGCAAVGQALIVVSTDFEEVATICDRVLVFRSGTIAAELQGEQITVARLLALAAGGAQPNDTIAPIAPISSVANMTPTTQALDLEPST